MKKPLTLFKSFFNQKQITKEQSITEVHVNAYSQPYVLQQRMKENKLTHGQTVKANLSPVRLERHDGSGKMHMYFCPMDSLNITEIVSHGDGGALPSEATLKGVTITKDTKPGLYNLKNVTLFSNGTLQVIANEDTNFEPYEESLPLPEMHLAYLEPISQLRFRERHRIQGETFTYEAPALPERHEDAMKQMLDSIGIPASRI